MLLLMMTIMMMAMTIIVMMIRFKMMIYAVQPANSTTL